MFCPAVFCSRSDGSCSGACSSGSVPERRTSANMHRREEAAEEGEEDGRRSDLQGWKADLESERGRKKE